MKATLFFLAIIAFLYSGSIEETMLPYIKTDEATVSSMLPPQYGYLKETIKKVNSDKEPQYTILYFFSHSVPELSFSNHLIEIAKFNSDHETKLRTMQSLIGVDMSLKSYLLKAREQLKKLSDHTKEIELIDIRMSPEVFEENNITSVPAIALAKCPALAHPSSCSIIAIAKGDISLEYFFKLLEDDNALPKELE